MNDNLTIKTKAFNQIYSDLEGSVRRAAPLDLVSIGQATLTIAHQEYTDSKTKVKGTRSNMRFQQDYVNSVTGQPVINFAQITVGRSQDAQTTDADILALIDALRQMIATTAADASALNLASAFAVTREQ